LRAAWALWFTVLLTCAGTAQVPVSSGAVKALEGPECTVSGRWKGKGKTPVLTSASGRERLYGFLQWDRPGKWTHQRCEAAWWVFASLDGGRFTPIMARQDFLHEGQAASLALAGFSTDAGRVGADVMTVTDGRTSHGYFVADLREHTSCMGSAVKGLDGVRSELQMGHEPMRSEIVGIRDDGWLDLQPLAQTAVQFEPCSGRLRVGVGR
jgi:hypothetical protein